MRQAAKQMPVNEEPFWGITVREAATGVLLGRILIKIGAPGAETSLGAAR